PPPGQCGAKLPVNATLQPGASLISPSGRYTLVMQSDGNLVLYDGGNPTWASNTATGDASYAAMQGDGNLVVYRVSDNQPTWSSVRGLVQGGPPPGATDDAELFVMYDGAFSPDPETSYFGYRNNTSKFLVRKRADDVVKIAYVVNGNDDEERSGQMSWDPNHT